MKRASLLIIALLLFSFLLAPAVKAESPGPWWVKSYEGGGSDAINDVKVLPDGSIIAVGYTNSSGSYDVLVMKLSPEGKVIWAKTYGGSDDDEAFAVAIAPNGDVIVAGYTKSFGAGWEDVWVLRLDENGNVKWQKTYGGDNQEGAKAVALAPNGDVIIAGYTESFGAGWADVWVLRLDENGNVKWQKTYGGKYRDAAYAVAIAKDGDIIVAGDIGTDSGGFTDIWVLRLDEKGNVKWQKIYGGYYRNSDDAYAVALSPNGDIIVAGYTECFGPGFGNIWILRLDANGNVKWQKTYGGSERDWATAVAIAPNGDIIVAGGTYNFGPGTPDNSNAWVLRLDAYGSVKWQKTYGSKYWDVAYAVTLASNGDIVIAAVYGLWYRKGNSNAWVLRLPPNGELPGCDFCKDSHAEMATSDANITDSSAIIYQSDAIVTNSNARVLNWNPIAKTQYSSVRAEKEKKQRLLALGMVVATLVITGSAYSIHKNRKKKKIQRLINEFNEILSKAETSPILEKTRLLKKAYNMVNDVDPTQAQKVKKLLEFAEAEISKRLKSMIEEAEEAIENFDIETAETKLREAEHYARAINEDLNPYWKKLERAKALKDREAQLAKLNELLVKADELVERREYEGAVKVLNEALAIAKSLDLEGKVRERLDSLRMRMENLVSKGDSAFENGNYVEALKLYSEALSIARALKVDASGIEEKIKRAEEKRKLELLKGSVKLDVPTEIPHKAEATVRIFITNKFSQDLRLTMDFSENADYFELSEAKVEFPRVRPGKTIGESLTVKPRFLGDFDFTVKVESNFGSFERSFPVKVVETARLVERTPTSLTRTPILNPVEALQELYSDFQYIGEGGFARVYKAKRKDGKTVALKIPKTLDPAVGRAFVREITNWLHLKHPNIVELYDVNVLPVPYLEMEYCESSLARLQKSLPVDEASLIVFNIAEALKYAHSKKIVHRDLKPSNVLLKNGLPKISDWGLSKVLEESMSATTTASFTPFYAAPEQIDKKYGHTDERTDIWQLGVIFYELVTGRLPFEGSLSQVMMGILRNEPVPPSQFNPEAEKVEPIIMRMLAKRKEERYQSVEELQRDLAKVLNMTYSESLKESKTLGDVRRATYYLTELLLINLKTNNAGEAYKYASDLAFYVRGELKEEVQKLAEQIKFRLEEGLDIPQELIEKAEIVVHKIRVGFEKV